MKTTLVITLAAAALHLSAFADQPTKSPEEIASMLKQVRPDLEFSEPTPSEIEGYYEVKTGPQYLYVSETGEKVIAGDIFIIENNEFVKLKDLEKRALRKDLLAKINKSDEIIFSPTGKAKGYIQVFTDVDCGFCQKLHQEVPALNARGIEVRYLAYPRTGLESESYRKIASAWCAKDQQSAITKLKSREEIPINVCEKNPVASQYELGNEIELSGTPTLVFPNGRMISGYINADKIAQILDIE